MWNYDFLLERRLKEQNSDLAYRYTCCTALFEQMLKKFLATFPTFTDHTLLHTLSVTNISNQLLREAVYQWSASEVYIYLMSTALHDIGMGVSDKDLEPFIDASGIREYVDTHPEESKPNLIRKFHNDFSAAFVKKYWELLEIPNQRYAEAIAEVSRGHRKTDLMDESLYPVNFDLGDGNTANLAVLAAMLRIADELDVASDRNPDLLYDAASIGEISQESSFEFSKHEAIHTVEFLDDSIRICADTEQESIMDGVRDGIRTVKKTMAYCVAVMEARGEVRIACPNVELILNGREVEV